MADQDDQLAPGGDASRHGTGLGALLASGVAAIAGLLLYLYVAEPLISRIAVLGPVTARLPGMAADGLTQASQPGVWLLPPWQGGLVFAAWAAARAAAGTVMAARGDLTEPGHPITTRSRP